MYFQLMSLAAEAIIAPTMINVQPVAQGGMDAKTGAKKMEIKKQIVEACCLVSQKPYFKC
jgi:hypothetical protein